MVIDGTGSSELIFNVTVLSAWQKVTLEAYSFFFFKARSEVEPGLCTYPRFSLKLLLCF